MFSLSLGRFCSFGRHVCVMLCLLLLAVVGHALVIPVHAQVTKAATPSSSPLPTKSAPVAQATPAPLVYDYTFIKQRSKGPLALLGITYRRGMTQTLNTEAIAAVQVHIPTTLCNGVEDWFKCERKYEQEAIASGHAGIMRNGDKLIIPLSGDWGVVLTDTTNMGYVRYLYAEYLPTIHQHHLIAYYYEGADDILINAQSGAVTVIPYAPVVSPDHKRFVAAGASFSSAFMVQIWNVQRDHINLETDFAVAHLHDGETGEVVQDISWLTPTTVRIVTIHQVTQMTNTLTVSLSPQGWQTAYNGQKIPVPAVYPELVHPPYITFGVDMAAVGKRVYADREYTFKEVPDVVKGQPYLLFANNNMRIAEADYAHFTVAKPATVYIGFDLQASELPGWLDSSWQPTPDIVATDDVVKLRLYKKDFEAGDEVTLGGNWAPPASGIRSHYLVFVATNQTE